MRTLSDLRRQIPDWSDAGLSTELAHKSLALFGPNKLTPLPREPLWKKFLDKFDEPIIKILLAAALLSMFVELLQVRPVIAGSALAIVLVGVVRFLLTKLSHWLPSFLFVAALATVLLGLIVAPGHPLIEGLAVMIAVILATGVAFASEYKSDREFEALNEQKDALRVKVLRDAEVHSIGMEEVVVGDLVQLETGDEIPADGRVLKAAEFFVDQSLMTGESEPARKRVGNAEDTADGPELAGCLYRGTQVVDGLGVMVVTEVGDQTYLGKIARRLSGSEDETTTTENAENRVKRKLTISKDLTPLQLKLKNLADLISLVGYIAAGLIFAALLIRGLFYDEVRWEPTFIDPLTGVMETTPTALIASGKALLGYFVYMVIIIVVAVPEGLPMSVTVSLALAMQKMTRANSLVRQLVACETIGSATVICSDKTGTLTQNKMQVVRFYFDRTTTDRDTPSWESLSSPKLGTDSGPLAWMSRISALDSTANLEHKEGRLIPVGNSTEGALLLWLHESGLSYEKLRQDMPKIYQIHFSSERKRMTTVVRHGDHLVSLCKSAPEWLLEHSTKYLANDGEPRPWTPEAREFAEAWLLEAAGKAMRTLAFGYALLPPGTPEEEESLHERRDMLEAGFIFVGFVAIRDPLRPDVKAAIAECRSAGIEVKMITGDNVETARAIAHDLGLIDRGDEPIDSDGAVVLTSPKYNEYLADLNALKGHEVLTAAQIQQRETMTQQLTGLRSFGTGTATRQILSSGAVAVTKPGRSNDRRRHQRRPSAKESRRRPGHGHLRD